MNECALLLDISIQLKSASAYGSASDGQCCTGPIVCDLNRKIIEINFSNQQLKGTLPDSLFNFSSLVEINLSDNPALIGRLPKLSSGLRYIDVSNTGLSGPVDISSLYPDLRTCKFGIGSKLCIQSQSLPVLCSGVRDLELCSLRSVSPSATVALLSTTTILSSLVSTSSNSALNSEIRLDHSDISTPIIIMWTIAVILMAVSLLFCLCLMFAHKYGKSDKVASINSSKPCMPRKLCRLNPKDYQNGELMTRFESLVENRSIYAARAEILADRIISRNGERYFPVISEHIKIKQDEMRLSTGDTVTLYKVFDDGWAEGVSLRNGSSAYFPLKCLGGSVPSILQDPEFCQSNLLLESDLESITSPLPPILNVTPVFLSSASASRHTILPLFDTKTSRSQLSSKSEKLIDLDSVDVKEEPDATPLLRDRNLDFDSSYNPFRGSLLNRKSSADVSFPKMIHSAESSSEFDKNIH